MLLTGDQWDIEAEEDAPALMVQFGNEETDEFDSAAQARPAAQIVLHLYDDMRRGHYVGCLCKLASCGRAASPRQSLFSHHGCVTCAAAYPPSAGSGCHVSRLLVCMDPAGAAPPSHLTPLTGTAARERRW